MKKELKKYQKVLIVIALFIVTFGLSFSMLYFFEGAQVTEALTGEDFVHADYIETIDGTYIGDVFNGAFEGEGKFDFVTKEIYNGHWSNSTMSGDGKMLFPEVGTYVGEYSESMRNGAGVFTWKNGDNYDGKWSEDKMNGEGVYTFTNGNCISGTFENNKIK